MGRQESTQVGRDTQVSGDAKYNMITQNSDSMSHTVGGLALLNGGIQVGQEFTLIARCGITANVPDTPTTYTVNLFSKDAPWKFRVLEVRFEVIDLTVGDWTDGDSGNLDITVQDGDGAGSESFSDILADQALDDDFANGLGVSYPHATVGLTNTEIDAGESLRCLVIAEPDSVGATNDGVLIDFILRCMRVQ